jgi:hypothetical protein
MHDGSMADEQQLARRIREYMVAAIASFSLQGGVLAYALFTEGSTRVWTLWAAVFALSVATISVALVRATRLSKRFRSVKWGEK